MTINSDYQRDWPKYFEAVGSQGPRDTLLRALAAIEPRTDGTPRVAIDVACGEGRDTREMLRQGWRVFAFDAHPLGISKLMESVQATYGSAGRGRLECRVLSFEEVPTATPWPTEVDLVNASFALPFCPPEIFPVVWKRLVDSLAVGGVFAGQIFGNRDEWASIRPQSHYTLEEMRGLFTRFEFVHLEEVEKDGSDALMKTKHHHLYHIVARKIC